MHMVMYYGASIIVTGFVVLIFVFCYHCIFVVLGFILVFIGIVFVLYRYYVRIVLVLFVIVAVALGVWLVFCTSLSWAPCGTPLTCPACLLPAERQHTACVTSSSKGRK